MVILGCNNMGGGGGQITLLSVCLTLMRRVSLACMPSFVDLGYLEVAVCLGGGISNQLLLHQTWLG